MSERHWQEDNDSNGAKLVQKLLRPLLKQANQRTEHYTLQHRRPKFTQDIGTVPFVGVKIAPTAIVMQGPVLETDDFTLETLKLYRKHTPECQLILSTWEDTPKSVLSPIEALGVDVVLSEKPKVPGLFNINMQLQSAAAGVRKAAEDGAEWILKTRVDQRLYNPHAIACLQSTAELFPVRTDLPQRYRILGVGQGSLWFAPYHVTDQTVFGHAEDMLKYWTPPQREGELPEGYPKTIDALYTEVPVREACRHGVAETYITSQFLERLGRPLTWTLEDSWAAYSDHFCFVDYVSTGFFWVKSQTWTLQESTVRYDRITNRLEIGFMDWLLLHSGRIPRESARAYEHALELLFMQDVAPAVE